MDSEPSQLPYAEREDRDAAPSALSHYHTPHGSVSTSESTESHTESSEHDALDPFMQEEDSTIKVPGRVIEMEPQPLIDVPGSPTETLHALSSPFPHEGPSRELSSSPQHHISYRPRIHEVFSVAAEPEGDTWSQQGEDHYIKGPNAIHTPPMTPAKYGPFPGPHSPHYVDSRANFYLPDAYDDGTTIRPQREADMQEREFERTFAQLPPLPPVTKELSSMGTQDWSPSYDNLEEESGKRRWTKRFVVTTALLSVLLLGAIAGIVVGVKVGRSSAQDAVVLPTSAAGALGWTVDPKSSSFVSTLTVEPVPSLTFSSILGRTSSSAAPTNVPAVLSTSTTSTSPLSTRTSSTSSNRVSPVPSSSTARKSTSFVTSSTPAQPTSVTVCVVSGIDFLGFPVGGRTTTLAPGVTIPASSKCTVAALHARGARRRVRSGNH